jgi:hypothetical protein
MQPAESMQQDAMVHNQNYASSTSTAILILTHSQTAYLIRLQDLLSSEVSTP